MNIKNEVLVRMYIVLAVFLLVAVLLFAQTVKISYFQGEKWRAVAKDNYVKYESVPALRGNVLSDDGSLLAASIDKYDIHFDLQVNGLPKKVFEKNVDSLAYCLSKYVNNKYTPGGQLMRLREAREKGARYFTIAKNVSYEKKNQISKFPIFNRGRHRGGLIVERVPKRDMPFKLLAKRTIGYASREGANDVGVEGAFDNFLSGKNGQRLTLKVSEKTRIPINEKAEIEPEDGNHVKTTLDIGIQDVAEEALMDALKYHNAQNGTVILMDVKTGQIKALANLEKTPNGYWETFNYGIGTNIEPGSVLKLAPVMSLLEDGHLDINQKVPTYRGKRTFYDEEMVDSSNKGADIDSIPLLNAFAHSLNVAIASATTKYYQGTDKEGNIRAKSLLRRFEQFNITYPTGIELAGEPMPFIKDPVKDSKEWSGLTLPWMSTGYEMQMTPLQILAFYNAVANDGKYMKPYLVSDILNKDGCIKKIQPTVLNERIASKSTIAKAKLLLEEVVKTGTARKLKNPKYQFSGKTGTSQINYKDQRKKAQKKVGYRSSFVGYFPSKQPRYSCIVVITDPKENGIYGADVAGPVFRKIIDNIFFLKPELHQALNNYKKPRLDGKDLPGDFAGNLEDMEIVLKALDVPYVNKSSNPFMTTSIVIQDSVHLIDRPKGENLIPNVVGMGVRDALYVLENEGVEVKFKGKGKVTKQSISPGTRIKGQTIHLTLG